MKIGIMGGTFDPIHNGHLMLGQAAYEAFGLDQVWFMPNGNPPHKDAGTIESNVEDRVEMVRLAIAPFQQFCLELYEASAERVSCSYRTMEHFNKIYPEHEFYFIIGADSLFALETWVHPERLFPTCTLLAAYRDEMNTESKMQKQINYLQEKYGAEIRLLVTPVMQVSSSELRMQAKEGSPISEYVPEQVEAYICKNHLYE